MVNASRSKNASLGERLRKFFTDRDFIFHDGRDLRRFSIAGRTQAVLACMAALTVAFSGYGVVQAAVGAIVVSGVAGPDTSPQAQMSQMREQVEKMQADVEAAKQAAKVHAAIVEKRQTLISALISGNADRAKIEQALPTGTVRMSAIAEEVLAPLRQLEARQLAVAGKARAAGEARYQATAEHIRALGLAPERFVTVPGAMGGPYEPVDGSDAATAEADAQFQSLFLTWKKLDSLEQSMISIPSIMPVDRVTFTSTFGYRVDPFRGTMAMHPGVDIPGAIGTPIYATADGLVSRADPVQASGGYGNMVEIDHGRGIATRYGHMSKILVAAGTRIHRGQLIGLMGSTGRSTGSHLHYEVRVDGKAVNPMPFLQTGQALAAVPAPGAVGGAGD